MMKPGFYWYLEANQPPTIVEVAEEECSAPPHLYVYFIGTDCDAQLEKCQGKFIGPIEPPIVRHAQKESDDRRHLS